MSGDRLGFTPGGNPTCPKCGRWYGPGETHTCSVSGDQLDLDAIEERNKIAWEVSADEWVESRDKCDAFSTTANDVPALVAEVRRLRAQVERVEALADAWNETPDYTPSDYDRGRVEQRHDMTGELLDALNGP